MAKKITTVEEYIERASPEHQDILRAIQAVVQKHVPFVTEKISFGIPMYHYFGMCFYYNITKRHDIELCVCRGKDLQQTFPQLDAKNRSIIAGITIQKIEDIQTFDLATLLVCAVEWNEQAKKLGIPMVQRPTKPAQSSIPTMPKQPRHTKPKQSKG
jgi:uncharacterized protein